MIKRLIVPANAKASSSDRIEKFLRSRIIDQDRAIKEIVNALTRGEAGLQDPEHPLGVFLFLGPTGVGKTHTALELANAFTKKVWRCSRYEECGYETTFQKASDPAYETKTVVICPRHQKSGESFVLEKMEMPALWQIDCGQLSDHKGPMTHFLLGAPVGYVGHEKKPILHGKAPKVVLFDEVEKAIVPRNWWEDQSGLEDILLKIMQKGRITNQSQEEVDFTESFIIMTGNLGTRDINAEIGKNSAGFLATQNPVKKISQLDDAEIDKLNDKIYRIIKERVEKEFPPEFINRIDRLVVFRFLNQESYRKIFDRELEKIQERISKSPLPFKLKVTAETKMFFIDEAFSDRQYGTNPLKRLLEKKLVSELSKLATHKVIKRDSIVQVGIKNDQLTFGERENIIHATTQEGGE